MQHLTDKQLRNLTTEQLDEIRREVSYGVSYLEAELRMNNSKGDYDRKRSLEKYLMKVKAVLQHKRNTGQK